MSHPHALATSKNYIVDDNDKDNKDINHSENIIYWSDVTPQNSGIYRIHKSRNLFTNFEVILANKEGISSLLSHSVQFNIDQEDGRIKTIEKELLFYLDANLGTLQLITLPVNSKLEYKYDYDPFDPNNYLAYHYDKQKNLTIFQSPLLKDNIEICILSNLLEATGMYYNEGFIYVVNNQGTLFEIDFKYISQIVKNKYFEKLNSNSTNYSQLYSEYTSISSSLLDIRDILSSSSSSSSSSSNWIKQIHVSIPSGSRITSISVLPSIKNLLSSIIASTIIITSNDDDDERYLNLLRCSRNNIVGSTPWNEKYLFLLIYFMYLFIFFYK